ANPHALSAARIHERIWRSRERRHPVAGLDIAERDAAGAIEQHAVVERVADLGAYRRIEIHLRLDAESGDVVGHAALVVREFGIALDPDHGVTPLPVITGVETAHRAGRVDVIVEYGIGADAFADIPANAEAMEIARRAVERVAALQADFRSAPQRLGHRARRQQY